MGFLSKENQTGLAVNSLTEGQVREQQERAKEATLQAKLAKDFAKAQFEEKKGLNEAVAYRALGQKAIAAMDNHFTQGKEQALKGAELMGVGIARSMLMEARKLI